MKNTNFFKPADGRYETFAHSSQQVVNQKLHHNRQSIETEIFAPI